MKNVILVITLLLLVGGSEVSAISCRAGRPGCIASCQVQNCATGNCVPPNKDGVCVCSRCGPGAPPR